MWLRCRTVEYSLIHVRATPENLDAALRAISADWSYDVIKPRAHLLEAWSTVRVTQRTASHVAPLLSEALEAPVLTVSVAGERFDMSYWEPGAPLVRADGYRDAAANELAVAFGKDPARLLDILRSSIPAAERHAAAAGLLQLPLPVVTGYEPVFDAGQTIQPSELPKASARIRRRRTLRRVFGILVLVEIVAFLVVDYFWFLEPSARALPALAFFVVNGIAVLGLWRWLRKPKPASTRQ